MCAIDSRQPRDGAYIESIGVYDPFIDDDRKKVRIDRERAEHWLSVGALPSETVASFLRQLSVTGLVRSKKPSRKRAMNAKARAKVAKHVAALKKAGKAGKTKKKSKSKSKPSKKKD